MKKHAFTIALAAAATLASTNAFSATTKFSKSDSNRDGALTRTEACAGRTPSICKHFDRIDANRDGFVTRAEVKAYNNAKRYRRSVGMKP